MKEKYTEEGLYFNMPEEEYHALEYLSRSTMENILIDIEEAWYKSCFNPDKPIQNPTEPMKLGTAIHSAILEPDIFNEIYCKQPSMRDFEDKVILNTNEELSQFLVSVGEKKTGKKEELIARALQYVDPEKMVIWDVVQKEFLNSINNGGKRSLSLESSEIIEGIQDSIKRRPKIPEIFSKGYSEVTIIWRDDETGIMCKCRMDYVRPEIIGEVKSFSLKGKKSIYKACCDEVVNQKYNFQFMIYSHALETIIRKIRTNEAKVYGEVDKEWLEEFLKLPKKQFAIAFVRTTAPFQSYLMELEQNINGGTDNSYYTVAETLFRTAITKFDRTIKKFGDQRWIEEDYSRKLSDNDVYGIQYQYIQ